MALEPLSRDGAARVFMRVSLGRRVRGRVSAGPNLFVTLNWVRGKLSTGGSLFTVRAPRTTTTPFSKVTVGVDVS